MKEIPLTQGKVAVVDDEDFGRLNVHKWFAARMCNGFRAVRKVAGLLVYMHREVLSAPKGTVVDHINHDALDNRKANLRLCTQGDNNKNRRLDRSSKTGFKGVTYRKDRGLYQARIRYQTRCIHLGFHDTPEAAAEVYDRAARLYFGDFAYTNKQMGLLL